MGDDNFSCTEEDGSHYTHRWSRKLLSWGVEVRGEWWIQVCLHVSQGDCQQASCRSLRGNEQTRNLAKYSSSGCRQISIYCRSCGPSYSHCILVHLYASFAAGTLGPVIFGLGLRDTCLVILFFNLLCSALPAYLTTWGPKLGLRQMCQARYSFGYVSHEDILWHRSLSAISMQILRRNRSQCIQSRVNGRILYFKLYPWGANIIKYIERQSQLECRDSSYYGYIIIGRCDILTNVVVYSSLKIVSFCGLRVLSWYERVAWIPVLVVYVVALGVGGKHLGNPLPAAPASASTILSFASTIAGFVITYSPLASDFTIYYTQVFPGNIFNFHVLTPLNSPYSWKIFLYSYLGFNIPIILCQCLGAAVVVAVPSVPAWSDGYDNGNVGGLLEAMLRPTGNFGKFLTVLLALSVTANIAPTFYSFSLSFQVFIPPLVVVPRYLFSILATAILIPVSIVGSHKFYDTLTNFLGLIGYWASAFGAVVLLEHLVIRRGDFAAYDLRYWNDMRRLPTGIAALSACALACALIVPSMDQVWFVGPIAQKTGDIGFELAFVATAIFYVPLRYLELRFKSLV
ncbi:Purine-cytosine permease fcyB [Grifola frondosa]|uniref:Purine-cytosine permease fcyB n=1 Tax=Grifola frondosa TaxID=5627 RepID=A0A1C7MLG2_GRIFR|nr:Purine-cytosine permease fcyB [Grifola frondosa]